LKCQKKKKKKICDGIKKRKEIHVLKGGLYRKRSPQGCCSGIGRNKGAHSNRQISGNFFNTGEGGPRRVLILRSGGGELVTHRTVILSETRMRKRALVRKLLSGDTRTGILGGHRGEMKKRGGRNPNKWGSKLCFWETNVTSRRGSLLGCEPNPKWGTTGRSQTEV